MLNWRARIIGDLLPKAETAARGVCPEVLRVDFDWRNALFVVSVPESLDVDDDEVDVAVHRATGIHASLDAPPTFPFTSHVRQTPGLVRHLALRGVDQPVRWDAGEIAGLRAGYDELAAKVTQFTTCATFALGGLPTLAYIAGNLKPNPPSTEEEMDRYLAAVEDLQRKFHVHEGLNWEVGNPTPVQRFHHWLSTLQRDAPIIIIDTTFSGGGINQIVNRTLEAPARPAVVEVHGLIDRSRTASPPPGRRESNSGGEVRSFLHPVPRLITEDQAALVGYDSLRSTGGLEPVWGAGTVELHGDGEILSVIGTSNLAHTLGDLVHGLPAVMSMDEDFTAASRYMALLTQLGNEEDRLKAGVRRALEEGIIAQDEAERELASLARRIGAARQRGRDTYRLR
jgi:hypothetical protein